MTVRIGLVGAGGWGKNLVRVLSQLDGCQLLAICDSHEPTLAAQRAAHPDILCTAQYSELLRNKNIDAVVVAVDVQNHYALARAALEADKHVFVEKPLTMDVAQAEALVSLAEQRGRRLMVGHLLLFHPAIRQVKSLIDAGELGDVLYLHSQRLNLGIIRSDENAWWSLAPHDISVALWLFGAMPSSVSAVGAAYLQTQKAIEDVVFASLRFADGRIAQIHVSWLDPQKLRKLTVVGSRRMLVFDDTAADEKLRIYDKGAAPRPGYTSYEDGVAVRSGDIVIPTVAMREPLAVECAELRDSIREDRAPRVTGQDGLDVVRVLAAGAESLRQGGAIVKL
jgi:predicted dehydrogenase